MANNKKFKLGFAFLFGLLLLQASGTASAFTLIEIPDQSTSPGNTVTDATTFKNQIEPLTGAIRTHIRNGQRRRETGPTAQQEQVLASNSYAATMSDVEFIQASGYSGGGGLSSLWLNSTFSAYDNDFSRTRYDGDTHMLLIGYDYTKSDRYIFGVAVSIENTKINTDFNVGKQDIDGYSINPYFAYLISDTWSIDVGLGIGSYDTDQSRAIGAVNPAPPPLIITDIIDSDFSSDRDFLAANLTYSVPRGNWYLTGWLGILRAAQDQEGYTESDDTVVDSEDLDFKRWSLGGEAAYSYGASESYISLIYEKDTDVNEVEFLVGEQPANDDDSTLVNIGWRYYGSDLVASFELSSRQGAEDESENSISTTLLLYL
jgi:hypothetical protein